MIIAQRRILKNQKVTKEKYLKINYFYFCQTCDVTIENRIYREEFTRKKCKTAILLYCFHTAGILHIFMLYNMLGTGISFYRKSQINVNQIMK